MNVPVENTSTDHLVMVTCIDIETLFKEKRGAAINLIETLT